ncbi:PEP-CTERM sorting domain-containing protein [Trichocoleus sp. Lan]|uniref:PEP-CTERM sorting domain-containing protein n=1 Tax=Trichocoleus sp. Lan TaxID=2933927 RepID=UPI003296F6E7
MKNLSVATAGAAFIALGMLGEIQQASAASIIQDQTDGAYQILAFSPIGQTFTAEDTFIKSIGFYIKDFNPTAAPNDFSITINLYKGTSGVFLGSGVFDDLVDGFEGYADVDFSYIALTVGDTYTAIVEDDTVRWGLSIASDLGDPYPGGVAITNGNLQDNIDTRFRVLAAETESVPEPNSVLGLLAFGTLGAGSFLKRRQKKQLVSSVTSNV